MYFRDIASPKIFALHCIQTKCSSKSYYHLCYCHFEEMTNACSSVCVPLWGLLPLYVYLDSGSSNPLHPEEHPKEPWREGLALVEALHHSAAPY